MKKKVGIFMPARLSSERLPNKHTLPLNEYNVTMWDIACENLSKINNENKYVLIAKCDEELVLIAKKFNLKIIYRDVETTKADDPLNFVFKDIVNINTSHIMFLNPCVLNMSTRTVEDTINNFESSNSEYGTSVIKFKNWVLNNSGESVIDKIDFTKLSTKNIPDRFEFAHCFHIFNKDKFFEDGMMLKDGFAMLEVLQTDVLIDIDNESDYLTAKEFYKNKKHTI
ncbi:MAG: cytidylyltransferase domain-containing protein [Fusobacteriaceae bacterium]